jgi:putative Holliday junction resolvase
VVRFELTDRVNGLQFSRLLPSTTQPHFLWLDVETISQDLFFSRRSLTNPGNLVYWKDMKYMGIDYGTKRVGIAVSDDNGMIAFPRIILENTPKLLSEILEMIQSEGINEIVVGESLDQQGNRNAIMDDVDAFVGELEKLSGVMIHMQGEQFTSHFLKSFDFTKSIEKPVSRERKTSHTPQYQDAQAAASILQRFLDKR